MKKEIRFSINLDEQQLPTEIEWDASDERDGVNKICNSLMVFMWDKAANNSMSIDLWTRDMMVHQMNIHFFHIFMKLADTYQRATGNTDAANTIRQFAQQFSQQVQNSRNPQ